MNTTIKVDGMTCGHCVHAVTTELTALPSVTDVAVDLHAGATSTVTITSEAPLGRRRRPRRHRRGRLRRRRLIGANS